MRLLCTVACCHGVTRVGIWTSPDFKNCDAYAFLGILVIYSFEFTTDLNPDMLKGRIK